MLKQSLYIQVVAVLGTLVAGAAVKTGPEPGTTVPSFSLPDQNGRLQSLHSVAGPKGAMLVFFRSADW